MPLDAWLAHALPAPGSSPAFDGLMILASTGGLVGLAVGTPWWLAARARRLARTALVAMLVGLGVTLGLQLLVLRPRPELFAPLLPVPPLPSFPSGHVVLVVIAVVVLGAHRRALGLALVPVAALIAVSRVHVGHHHFTDVLGGALLGAGLALGALQRERADPFDPWRFRWLLWPQLGLVLAISLVAYTGAFGGGRVVWLRLPGMDKVLHFLLFGLLALCMHFATRGRRVRLGPLKIPLAVLIPLLGALVEELAQAASPHRTADPLDLLADVLGMIMFWRLGCRMTDRVTAAGAAASAEPPPADRAAASLGSAGAGAAPRWPRDRR